MFYSTIYRMRPGNQWLEPPEEPGKPPIPPQQFHDRCLDCDTYRDAMLNAPKGAPKGAALQGARGVDPKAEGTESPLRAFEWKFQEDWCVDCAADGAANAKTTPLQELQFCSADDGGCEAKVEALTPAVTECPVSTTHAVDSDCRCAKGSWVNECGVGRYCYGDPQSCHAAAVTVRCAPRCVPDKCRRPHPPLSFEAPL